MFSVDSLLFSGNFVKLRQGKKNPGGNRDFQTDMINKSVDIFILINSKQAAFGNPAFNRSKFNPTEAAVC